MGAGAMDAAQKAIDAFIISNMLLEIKIHVIVTD
jgi:hypothetical protein